MTAPGQTIADATVAELQRVLTIYAQATGFALAFPGATDGIVGQKTALAVAAMVPRLPGLPAEIVAMAPLISLILATDQGRTEAFALIKRNATTITRAIIALEAYRLATGGGGGGPPVPAPTSGWKNQTVKAGWAAGILSPSSSPPTPPIPGGVLVPWWNTTKGKVMIGAGVAGTLLTIVVVIRAFSAPSY